MFTAIALALLSASADVRCTRWESATTVVTVCSKRTDAPKRWRWVFCTDVTGSIATVTDFDTHDTWKVPASVVGGSKSIGRSVQIFSSR